MRHISTRLNHKLPSSFDRRIIEALTSTLQRSYYGADQMLMTELSDDSFLFQELFSSIESIRIWVIGQLYVFIT